MKRHALSRREFGATHSIRSSISFTVCNCKLQRVSSALVPGDDDEVGCNSKSGARALGLSWSIEDEDFVRRPAELVFR